MGPMYSDLVRFHGAVMTAWVLLFAAKIKRRADGHLHAYTPGKSANLLI
jgi:hypothetical protein